ncbi:hypothetical protein NDU88_010827, partial [Pleurodeles waltl]
MSAIVVHAANSLALLGRYNKQLWSDISHSLDELPETNKSKTRKILLEGQHSSSEIIDCTIDIAAMGFRLLAGSAVLRRQGWLKATNLRPEVQTKILDLPYDGEALFGKHVDDALQRIQADTDTA